jgi:hypothetical protein
MRQSETAWAFEKVLCSNDPGGSQNVNSQQHRSIKSLLQCIAYLQQGFFRQRHFTFYRGFQLALLERVDAPDNNEQHRRNNQKFKYGRQEPAVLYSTLG